MTLNRLIVASRAQFALNGYDGASLATIGNEVGIKKQSIYTYFKGKDELYLHVFSDSMNIEFQFIERYFEHAADLTLESTLYQFLNEYIKRYEEEINTSFFLRTLYYPPVHLRDHIVNSGNYFLDSLHLKIIAVLEEKAARKQFTSEVSSEDATIAYLSLLDGLFIEMLFAGIDSTTKRLEASWKVYWRGIQ